MDNSLSGSSPSVERLVGWHVVERTAATHALHEATRGLVVVAPVTASSVVDDGATTEARARTGQAVGVVFLPRTLDSHLVDVCWHVGDA